MELHSQVASQSHWRLQVCCEKSASRVEACETAWAWAFDNQNAFSDSVEYSPSIFFFISRAECSSQGLSRQLQVVQLFGQVLSLSFFSGHGSNGSNWSGCRHVCQWFSTCVWWSTGQTDSIRHVCQGFSISVWWSTGRTESICPCQWFSISVWWSTGRTDSIIMAGDQVQTHTVTGQTRICCWFTDSRQKHKHGKNCEHARWQTGSKVHCRHVEVLVFFSVSACQGKPGRIFEKNVVRHFGDRSDDQRGIVWGGWFEPTVTVTSRSNAFRQMAHILEQKQKCDWFETVSVDPTENAWRVSEWFSMGQCVQSRKSSERAANQEAFAEASWIRSGFCRLVSATEKFFDTGALKEFGWLKINAFIGDCLYVIPSGKQCPFKEYFNGAVVLETIYFSVSDLRKDDPIQHGLLQVTVMTAPLHTVCKQLPEKQVQQFADRIGYMLQSLVFFIEASSEENKCCPNLWVADYKTKTNYSRKKAK